MVGKEGREGVGRKGKGIGSDEKAGRDGEGKGGGRHGAGKKSDALPERKVLNPCLSAT